VDEVCPYEGWEEVGLLRYKEVRWAEREVWVAWEVVLVEEDGVL
jgi:hypothetical protein